MVYARRMMDETRLVSRYKYPADDPESPNKGEHGAKRRKRWRKRKNVTDTPHPNYDVEDRNTKPLTYFFEPQRSERK